MHTACARHTANAVVVDLVSLDDVVVAANLNPMHSISVDRIVRNDCLISERHTHPADHNSARVILENCAVADLVAAARILDHYDPHAVVRNCQVQ